MLDEEAVVAQLPLATHAFEIGLPGLAVGRIREHEVELLGGEGIVGEGGAVLDVVRFVPFSLENEIGLADSIGLRVHLLTVQVNRGLLALFAGQLHQRLFGDRQHSAGAARAIVDQVRSRLDLIGHRLEDEVRHQPDHVARREVLAGLLVVLLVETANQLLEDGTHAMVVQARQPDRSIAAQHGPGAEIDGGIQELLDQEAESIGLDQRRNLVAKLELLQNLLNVGRKAIEVRLEIGPQLLLPGSGPQIAEAEGRRIVEGLAGRLTERRMLVSDTGLV